MDCMKPIACMSRSERQSLVRELEITERRIRADLVELRWQQTALCRQMEAKESQLRALEGALVDLS